MVIARTLTPARALAAVVASTLLVAGCGDGGSTVATPPSASVPVPGVSPSATAPTAGAPSLPASDIDQDIAITYADGKASGDTGRVSVALGSRVRIVVSSDVAEELHLHVYDIKKVVTPGQAAELVFTADVPGQVELELEQARTTLVRLVIS